MLVEVTMDLIIINYYYSVGEIRTSHSDVSNISRSGGCAAVCLGEFSSRDRAALSYVGMI